MKHQKCCWYCLTLGMEPGWLFVAVFVGGIVGCFVGRLIGFASIQVAKVPLDGPCIMISGTPYCRGEK